MIEARTLDRQGPKDRAKHRVMHALALAYLPTVWTGTLLLERPVTCALSAPTVSAPVAPDVVSAPVMTLPAAMPVSVTIINSTALGRMSIAVHLIPTLSRILIHADAALVLIGLATARRRRLLPGRRRSRRRESDTYSRADHRSGAGKARKRVRMVRTVSLSSSRGRA